MFAYHTLKNLSLVAIIMLLLDGIYLYLFSGSFRTMITNIQSSALILRYTGIIACYLLLVCGIYYFILLPKRPIIDAFLLGVVIYGVYDTTNYSTISKWRWDLALLDTLWGGTLFALTSYMYYLLLDD
jgi:uncharacterized membrane protein